MKILIPVDGSAASRAAIDFVASRAGLLSPQPELRLLNVQLPIPPRAARAAGRELVRNYYQKEAHAVLDAARERLSAAGLRARTRYAVGHPGERVARAAVHGHPDLVVMGSRGQTALQGLIFGSVTQAVLAASTVPLLVLREHAPAHPGSLRVVLAVDGSRHSLAAVRAVLAWRPLFGPSPKFEAVHVLDERDEASRFDAIVGPALALCAKAQVDAEPVRLVGRKPGDVIADHVARRGADLVAMGSHGRGPFKQLLLGSVVTRVAARSRLPLMIVRPRPRRPAPRDATDRKAATLPRAREAAGEPI